MVDYILIKTERKRCHHRRNTREEPEENVTGLIMLVVKYMLLGSLSNDNGDGNGNVISKYKFALF